MITHLFYHQETVEEQCAVNGWLSIRDWFAEGDEVIILDLGNTLKNTLPLSKYPKYLRIEKVRTDIPEERSYTYGLNLMIPEARNEWVCLWRSDYIYHKSYFTAMQHGMNNGNVVLPYECLIGADYCNSKWCNKNLFNLRNSVEGDLLEHAVVCPSYEMRDFSHFAIKKSLWIEAGGMDKRLWGYGPQFPDFFYRLSKMDIYQPSIQYEMIAFHQTHSGSFGLNTLSKRKYDESNDSYRKMLDVFGSEENIKDFQERVKQNPLRERRNECHYKLRITIRNKIINKLKRIIWRYGGINSRISKR